MQSNGFTISLQSSATTPTARLPARKPLHLETEHLITRTLTAADVTPAFTKWFNDANMLRGLNIAALNFSIDGLRAFVATYDNVNNLLVGIFHKADGMLLGFYDFSIDRRHRIATLTLGASPEIKVGRKIFWQSWPTICDELFDNHQVEKITSRVLASNRKLMFAVLDTEHFVYEGLLKQEILAENGQRLDVLVLSVFKDLALRPQKNAHAS